MKKRNVIAALVAPEPEIRYHRTCGPVFHSDVESVRAWDEWNRRRIRALRQARREQA